MKEQFINKIKMTIRLFGHKAYCVWGFVKSNREVEGFLFANSISLLKEALSILEDKEIFFLDEVIVFDGASDIKWTGILYNKFDFKIIIESVSFKNTKDIFIKLKGYSRIYTSITDSILVKDIDLSYTVNSTNLIIYSYCDCWVPIDFNGNLQLELAELNNHRIVEAIEEISKNVFDDDRMDESVRGDGKLVQYGFKVYGDNVQAQYLMSEGILSTSEYDKCKKYLL